MTGISARRLRVLVVDDSDIQRNMLAALLGTDPALEVIGRAANGLEAVRQAALLRPDVITIDLRMPGLDGIGATRRIMEATPTPVVMVASGLSPDDRRLGSEALAAGVLAIVPKPAFGSWDGASAAELIGTVKRMAEVRVIRRWSPERIATGQLANPGARAGTGDLPPRAEGGAPPPGESRPAPGATLVAIGASTGGPQALQAILPRLPATFAAPVVVVQHIAEGFAASIIDWLGPQCALPFQLARPGMRLGSPGIYLAPTGQHLLLRGNALVLNDDPPIRGHRPSVTALFRSVAASYGSRAVGVLLTGMGDDGAVGLAAMKQAGATTIAQDEASSVVFGMPAAAIALGVVDHILAPPQIPALLTRLTSQPSRRPARSLLPSGGPFRT